MTYQTYYHGPEMDALGAPNTWVLCPTPTHPEQTIEYTPGAVRQPYQQDNAPVGWAVKFAPGDRGYRWHPRSVFAVAETLGDNECAGWGEWGNPVAVGIANAMSAQYETATHLNVDWPMGGGMVARVDGILHDVLEAKYNNGWQIVKLGRQVWGPSFRDNQNWNNRVPTGTWDATLAECNKAGIAAF